MDICAQFHINSSTNPYTGRAIKIGGPTYRKLVLQCGNPSDIAPTPVLQPVVTAKTLGPQISQTVVTRKFLQPLIPQRAMIRPVIPQPAMIRPVIPQQPISQPVIVPQPKVTEQVITNQARTNIINNVRLQQNADTIIDELFKIRRIIGPNSFAVMELNEKIVLMFGDFHTQTLECSTRHPGDILLSDFFDLFGINSPVCTDLFIEGYNLDQGYAKQRNSYNESRLKNIDAPDIMLVNVLIKYWYCFGINKTLCNFGNLRIHNMDFRRNP